MPIVRKTDAAPIAGPANDTSLLEETFGALAVGVNRDPIFDLVLDEISEFAPQLSDENLADLEQRLRGSTTASVFETIGEYGSLILPGLGAFSAGRVGAQGLLKASGNKALKEARDFLIQRAGTTAASRQLAQVPLALRGAEAVGGSLGFGAEGFVRAKAEGEETEDALIRAAENFALSIGFEGGLIAIGRTPGLRRLVGERGASESRKALARREAETEVVRATQRKFIEAAARERIATPASGPNQLQSFIQAAANNQDLVARNTKASLLARGGRGKDADVFVSQIRTLERELEKPLLRDQKRLGEKVQQLSSAEASKYYEATLAKSFVGSAKDAKTAAKLQSRAVKATNKTQKVQKNLTAIEQELFVSRQLKAGLQQPERFAPVMTRYMDDLARFKNRGSRPIDKAANAFLKPLGFSADEMLAFTDRISLQFIKSPETAAKEMGFATAFMAEMGAQAARQSKLYEMGLRTNLIKDFDELAKLMGKGDEFLGIGIRKGLKGLVRGRQGKFAEPVRETYERGGIDAVRAQFGKPVADQWAKINNGLNEVYTQAAKLGGLPPITKSQLEQLRVHSLFPHSVRAPSAQETSRFITGLEKQFRNNGMTSKQAERAAKKVLTQIQKNHAAGLTKVGSLDNNRLLVGTTGQKAEVFGDFVETDPFKVLDNLYAALSHRMAFGEKFGIDGAVLDGMKKIAIKEGVPEARVQTLVDVLANKNMVSESTRKLSRLMVNSQIISKLGLATIPNLSQSINNVSGFGARNTLKGMRSLANPKDREIVMAALGVQDSAIKSFGRMIVEDLQTVQGVAASGPLDDAARAFLLGNGFAMAEGLNRAISAGTGLAVFRDVAKNAANGTLRGRKVAIARQQFAALGQNLDDLVRNKFYRDDPKRFAEILQEVSYNAARTTQFTPDLTRVPAFWQHPIGKVIFQFKSFAFNQGKFIRDNILREAERGNLVPLGQAMTVYPVAGGVVNEMLNQFRDKPKEANGLEQYISNFGAVGGFGVFQSMFYSLLFREAETAFLGPTAGDLFTITENLVQPDRLDEMINFVERQPSFRAGRTIGEKAIGIGGLAFGEMKDFVVEQSDSPTKTRILRKRQEQ